MTNTFPKQEFFCESRIRKGYLCLIQRDQDRLKLAIIDPNLKQVDLNHENGELKPEFVHGGNYQYRRCLDWVAEKPIPLEIGEDLKLIAQEAIDQFLVFEREDGVRQD